MQCRVEADDRPGTRKYTSILARHEDNPDVRHKRRIMGREVVIAITPGKFGFERRSR